MTTCNCTPRWQHGHHWCQEAAACRLLRGNQSPKFILRPWGLCHATLPSQRQSGIKTHSSVFSPPLPVADISEEGVMNPVWRHFSASIPNLESHGDKLMAVHFTRRWMGGRYLYSLLGLDFYPYHWLSNNSEGWHHSSFSLDTGGKEIAMAKPHFPPRVCGLGSWVRLVLPASPTLKSKMVRAKKKKTPVFK